MTKETDDFEKYLEGEDAPKKNYLLVGNIPKTHKEQTLAEFESLYDPNFEIPAGLYIPLGTRVLVKEITQDERKSKGGIIIAGAASLQNARIGIVYRVGESVTYPIKPGHKVAYDKFALAGIDYDGVQYTDLEEYQIRAVVPPDNYLAPKHLTNEELRRQQRQEFTKKSVEKTDALMDQINNDPDLQP